MGQDRPLPEQRLNLTPVVTADLTGKVICVTGANTGLGLEAAKHFARMNPQKLILTSRDQDKGSQALKKLIEETDFHRAEVWPLDLTSFSSVQQFADKAVKGLDRLDFLVANAGMVPRERVVTENGWETGLQVNDLSQELLAFLLLPKMLETAKRFSVVPRLVVVSSATHYWITGPESELMNATNIHETLSSEEYCSVPGQMRKRYSITKLMNIFFVRALTDHLPPSLLVNSINPGFCYSELRRNASAEDLATFQAMEREFGLTTEEGSRHIVYGATGGYDNPKEEEKLRGKYISLSEVLEESDFSISKEGYEMQNRIWDEILEILTKVDPRVGDIVKEHLI
ncbi:hypothetical protein C8J56DRAFT_1120539 [Mycena floridula]|nr:hypothetical protein C8J56DRAFT_1120539 [Mycena floridula]